MCLHARTPDVAESKELDRWLKRPRSAVQMRRAQLISFSAQGMRVQEISSTLYLHEEYVRQLIRQYNEGGLAALRTRARPGRPPTLTPEDESVVVEIAKMPPRAFGQPFNQWSLGIRSPTNGRAPGRSRRTRSLPLKKTHRPTIQAGPEGLGRSLL